MILFFTDRQLNIVGQASTSLPYGLIIVDDNKTEDIETGVAVFECTIPYDAKTRALVEKCADTGNYILRSVDKVNEFYTITEIENDTKNQEITVYAEDAGLDLLNEVVGKYEADKAYPIAHYIEKFAYDSGFVIGINEAKSLTKQLAWDDEATAAERIADVAAQFDGCEISYSFDVDNLEITNKHINIYKERGKSISKELRLNRDIDSIVTTKSILNVATALQVTGGTPEKSDEPITLKDYHYDDGDIYLDGTILKSRSALKKWSRYSWTKEPNKTGAGGHIVRPYSYDTESPAVLCSYAVKELEQRSDFEINYEVDIKVLPDNVRIGDRINIVDDAGELYVSARILQLETSVTQQEYKAVLGEYLIKKSGINQKVADLAMQFAAQAKTAARALALANAAQDAADTAQATAEAAAADVGAAQKAASVAQQAAETARQSAEEAQTAANNAQAAVEGVVDDVAEIEGAIDDIRQTASNAQQAVDTAQTKADEAAASAAQAAADAANANAAVEIAQGAAETATEKAEEAQETAETAQAAAESAQAVADAAKADASRANNEILSLGSRLDTVSTTMQAEYARKTDLTEAKADLQTEIAQNAAGISSTANKVQEIDETANNAQLLLQGAIETAEIAQAQADQAAADANAAQAAAVDAQAAADSAQAEADTARAAADTAQAALDTAAADLVNARAELEAVLSNVDATEDDIAIATAAVTAAQAAADSAQAEALAAIEAADNAQKTADTANASAHEAQAAAALAISKANVAQAAADEAQGNAEQAQAVAEQATADANAAQQMADTAAENAREARTAARDAAEVAEQAAQAAAAANEKVAQAQADLTAAQARLSDVTADASATEAEIAEAQAAVDAAQTAAETAQSDAESAQNDADNAQAAADTAREVADGATAEANEAQAVADEAHAAAEEAQRAVDGLAVRFADAETQIRQNADQIALSASKEEITETLSGYYTKVETQAQISVESDAIKSSVSATYADKESVSTQIEQLANEVSITFATKGELTDVDKQFNDQFNDIYKYILLEDGEATFGAFDPETGVKVPLKLKIAKEGIEFWNGNTLLGSWDGDNFYTGNIHVRVDERLRLGNFIALPRSDGSLMWLKAGG